MAAYGAQIAQGKTKAEALAYIDALFKNVPVQHKSAREALQIVRRRQGRRPARLRERGHRRAGRRRGPRLRHPRRDPADREPDRRRSHEQPRHRPGVPRLRAHAESQKIFGEKGYRPVDKTVARRVRLPDAAELFTIDGDLGGWKTIKTEFFDAENGDDHEDLRRARELPPSSVTVRSPRASPSPRQAGRFGAPLGMGIATLYMSLIVLIPFAALVDGAFENGWERVLGRDHRPTRPMAALRSPSASRWSWSPSTR